MEKNWKIHSHIYQNNYLRKLEIYVSSQTVQLWVGSSSPASPISLLYHDLRCPHLRGGSWLLTIASACQCVEGKWFSSEDATWHTIVQNIFTCTYIGWERSCLIGWPWKQTNLRDSTHQTEEGRSRDSDKLTSLLNSGFHLHVRDLPSLWRNLSVNLSFLSLDRITVDKVLGVQGSASQGPCTGRTHSPADETDP